MSQSIEVKKFDDLPPSRPTRDLPLARMRKGDFFEVPENFPYTSLRHRIRIFTKKHGGKFALRTKPTLRCYCVESPNMENTP